MPAELLRGLPGRRLRPGGAVDEPERPRPADPPARRARRRRRVDRSGAAGPRGDGRRAGPTLQRRPPAEAAGRLLRGPGHARGRELRLLAPEEARERPGRPEPQGPSRDDRHRRPGRGDLAPAGEGPGCGPGLGLLAADGRLRAGALRGLRPEPVREAVARVPPAEGPAGRALAVGRPARLPGGSAWPPAGRPRRSWRGPCGGRRRTGRRPWPGRSAARWPSASACWSSTCWPR